jgi:hypothetical protein
VYHSENQSQPLVTNFNILREFCFHSHFEFAGSKILSLLNEHSNREVQDASSFNLTHWRNILPTIGSGSSNYSSEMMQRQQLQQTQQRGNVKKIDVFCSDEIFFFADWHNDWTVMDPAIVAASASPRMTVENSWNRNMDGSSNYQRSINSLGKFQIIMKSFLKKNSNFTT